jgi:hypothetical protein
MDHYGKCGLHGTEEVDPPMATAYIPVPSVTAMTLAGACPAIRITDEVALF